MGNSSRKPYIFDEFGSDDDENYESAAENVPESTSSLLEDVNEIETIEESSPIGSSDSTVKGLRELLKFLEAHDYEGAQRVAHHLQKSNTFSTLSAECIEYDYPHESPSTTTSSRSSKFHEKANDSLNSNQEHQEAEGKVLNDDHQKVLAQLDEDLRLFEANEEKISSDASVFLSGIPRLRSSAARVGGSHGSPTDVTKRTQPERRRSPSPGSRLKASGIPRYAWAQVVSPMGGTCTGSPDVQTGDSSSVSKVCECLPEALSKVHVTAGRKTFSKPFAGDKPGFTHETSTGSTGNEIPVSDEKTIGSFPTWDINISEFTGRAKMNKKRSGLPSPWSRSEDHHTATKDHSLNETVHGIRSVSTELVADEPVPNKTAREYGEISQRKFLDLKRWYCISRPQYKTSCGISSLVSCWNYLFSTLGHGSYPPLTQEAAMKLLGYVPPFDIIQFGPVTGNRTLLRWFNQLNTHFQVRGKGYFMFKPSGKNQTPGVTDEMAWDLLKKGLRDPDMAFIYHCHNHYFCPIGTELTPQFCVDAYNKGEIGEPAGKWVLIGDTSRKHPSIHCKSWEDICLDLHCKSPSYFNIRQNWRGVLQHEKIKTIGNNLHCIMAFHKVSDKLPANLMLSSSSSSTSPKHRLSRLPTSSNSPPHSPVASDPQLSPDTNKDEVGSEFDDSLEDDEVGYENLDSEDDNVDENERPVKAGKENNDGDNVDEKKRDAKVVKENDMTDD